MPDLPRLLLNRRIAVLGSGHGLGRAVAKAAQAAGAEVLGIDSDARFDHIDALYRTDLSDPAAMDAVAQTLPKGLDGLALFPAIPDADPATQLAQALAAPKRLAEALAPTLAPGASLLTRAAPRHADWPRALDLIRAAAALRPGEADDFASRWALQAEAIDTPRLIGWAMLAWTLTHCHSWPGLRVNALTPASPDGHLPPAISVASGLDAAQGPALAAQAAVFLLSGLSAGLTGATIAADAGFSAQIQTRLEGL
ncbi:hypothetical protein [Pararhodobacter zhoushanensis]|uniref:hypothetical protein n=1 Tax=Pararhodobacter zhoushanensis TaxID=2479545 RepID=UPI000F8D0895|nr:hypothetical protein [Pararhodobacter zhoushanensis]